MDMDFCPAFSRSTTASDFSEEFMCIFRYQEELSPNSPFAETAAASVTSTNGRKKHQSRFFIKQSSQFGRCKTAYAEQVCPHFLLQD